MYKRQGLIYAIGAMIGIGSATRYAISRAKGENTDHYFVQSVTWSILAAVPFMLIGIFIPDKVLALLGADAGLIGLGRNYMRIILIATPFFMSNYTSVSYTHLSQDAMSAVSLFLWDASAHLS